MPKKVEGVSDWWAESAVKEDVGGIEERMEIVFDEAFIVGGLSPMWYAVLTQWRLAMRGCVKKSRLFQVCFAKKLGEG